MAPDNAVGHSVYVYAPNKVAPVIFAVFFLISSVWHFWQCVHLKSWKLTGMHVVAAFIISFGFALREYGASNYDVRVQSNVTIFIISICAIYMAPPILELANFHALGRILYFVPYHSPMHPGRMLTTFGSVASLVEIFNGVGIAWIAIPTLQSAANSTKSDTYCSRPLCSSKCIYRIIEHFGGSERKSLAKFDTLHLTLRHEWYFYVLEATMMLTNSLLWNARHPRLYLPEDYHIYLAQDGVTEIVGPG
ncbi:RTA1 domain protein [Paramyrothecium foliicola]|nr:RTA1 domain protein [Paramyrothecium foliicola]